MALDPDQLAASDAKRSEIVKALSGPIESAYEECKLTAASAAKAIKQSLKAKSPFRITVAGDVDPASLARGWRIVAKSIKQRVIIDKQTGEEVILCSTVSTVLETWDPDHPQRLRAAEKLTKDRGWVKPEELRHTIDGAIIHVHTHVPEPQPWPTEALAEHQRLKDLDHDG